MFQNYTLTGSTADSGRLISFERDWVGIGIRADTVSGTLTFKVQWSNDDVTWTDDPVAFAAVTTAGTYPGKRAILGLYWRLAVTTTGTASAICSAAAIY